MTCRFVYSAAAAAPSDMAVDITLLFKASVKTVKTRNKAIGVNVDSAKDEIFKKSRPKSGFSLRAKEVVSVYHASVSFSLWSTFIWSKNLKKHDHGNKTWSWSSIRLLSVQKDAQHLLIIKLTEAVSAVSIIFASATFLHRSGNMFRKYPCYFRRTKK